LSTFNREDIVIFVGAAASVARGYQYIARRITIARRNIPTRRIPSFLIPHSR
jgi:hypothetical protein